MSKFNPFAVRPSFDSGVRKQTSPLTLDAVHLRSNHVGRLDDVVALRGSVLPEDTQLDDFDKQLLVRSNETTSIGFASHIPSKLSEHEINHAQRSGSGVTSYPNDKSSTPTSAWSSTVPFSSPLASARQHTQLHLIERTAFGSNTFGTRNAFHDRLKKVKEENKQVLTEQKNLAQSAARAATKAIRGPVVQGIELVPATRLPDKYRSIFNFPVFNAVQSRCFPTAYDSDENLVVSAPTGSGKTVIMELGILRIMNMLKSGHAKAVYQAPTKSLCSERCRDWQSKFAVFDLQCTELTGDTEQVCLRNVATASIIVTTPEKWDSITRKWKDNAKLMNMIKLFLVDEVHILKDTRGATLEAIVSRMKTVGNNVRFIALSATIPNSEDIAIWLTRSEQARHLPAVREVFDDSFRPVQLRKHILGHEGPYNPWVFDNVMTEKIPNLVSLYGKGKPIMIFCPTKESAQKTADKLARSWQGAVRNDRAWCEPQVVAKVENESLQKVLMAAVAFHHGSLSAADRKTVERAFLSGDVSIVCSTSTLAVGVNLPCYLVILKGTQGYTDTGLREYSSLEVMQMLGRAGRPQFETEACAVILCLKERLSRYERMVAGEEVLESSLHQNLTEYLNAEIGLGTINSINAAKKWLASTFLNVRLQKNPQYYALDSRNHLSAEEVLLGWCEKDLNLLCEASLVENNHALRCTEYGDAMARYCVKFDTMKIFMAISATAKVSDILNTLCQAVEFREFRLRQGEKTFYKGLNKANEIRHPIPVDPTLSQHKVSLMIQAKLGGMPLGKDPKNTVNSGHLRQLALETNGVINHAKRLIRCIVDVLVQRSFSEAVNSALGLARSLGAGVWDDTVMQLKQIPGIGDVSMRKLAAGGIKTIDAIFTTEPHRLEVMLSKMPPFGLDLVKKAAEFPMLHISARECDQKRRPQQGVEIKIRCEVGFLNETIPFKFNRRGYNILFMCETSYGHLIDFRRFGPSRLKTSEEILLTALVDQPGASLRCHIMCDDIAGTHRSAEIGINCPSSWFPSKLANLEITLQHPGADLKKSRTVVQEDFGDGGLEDGDLLAAANKCCSGEIVEDIDDIVPETRNQDSLKNTRKRSRTVSPYDGLERFREPKQLPGGRWTCQHICKDEGKECKHRCCREGVKKPTKKRQKKDGKVDKLHANEPVTKGDKDDVEQSRQLSALDRLWRPDHEPRNELKSRKPSIQRPIGHVSPSNSNSQNSTNVSQKTNGIHLDAPSNYSDSQAISDVVNFDDYDWQTLDEIAATLDHDLDSSIAVTDKAEPQNVGVRNKVRDDQYRASGVWDDMAHEVPSTPNGFLLTPISSHYKHPTPVLGFRHSESPQKVEGDTTVLNSCSALELTNEQPKPQAMRSLSKTDVESSPLTKETCMKEQSRKKDDECLDKETEYERQQRVEEEDQRRRWADLGSEFLTYETFGKYIRIVDGPE